MKRKQIMIIKYKDGVKNVFIVNHRYMILRTYLALTITFRATVTLCQFKKVLLNN